VPEDVRQRLFEPFFTTKEAGVGLGLGLAISRDIVREFHGDLDVDNRPEGGACFTVRLPAVPTLEEPTAP
jgi:two-component system C4-dicarboxylate transport sensor histidine kinase DctB